MRSWAAVLELIRALLTRRLEPVHRLLLAQLVMFAGIAALFPVVPLYVRAHGGSSADIALFVAGPPGVQHPGPGARRPPRRSGRPQAGADREPAGVRGPLPRPLRQPGPALAAGPAPGRTGRVQRRLPPGAPDRRSPTSPRPGIEAAATRSSRPARWSGSWSARPSAAPSPSGSTRGSSPPRGSRCWWGSAPWPGCRRPGGCPVRPWPTRERRRASPIRGRRPAPGWTPARGRLRPALPHPGVAAPVAAAPGGHPGRGRRPVQHVRRRLAAVPERPRLQQPGDRALHLPLRGADPAPRRARREAQRPGQPAGAGPRGARGGRGLRGRVPPAAQHLPDPPGGDRGGGRLGGGRAHPLRGGRRLRGGGDPRARHGPRRVLRGRRRRPRRGGARHPVRDRRRRYPSWAGRACACSPRPPAPPAFRPPRRRVL